MTQEQPLRLQDGREISLARTTYPLPAEQWPAFIRFWQTEWSRTDVDWLEALRGALAETLTIEMASAKLNGAVVGTASVYYPSLSPEACCVADVLTAPEMRGLGIAATLAAKVVESAFAKGCKVAYLGNSQRPQSVYEKIGFRRVRGAIMRRAAAGAEGIEQDWYALDQPLSLRETVWGDLPGVAALLAQPLQCSLPDYSRGLVSLNYSEPKRCVSNFTTVRSEVEGRGGAMMTLVGSSPNRVLGFGSFTPDPGPAREEWATIEAAAHDNYQSALGMLLERLISAAAARGCSRLCAYAAAADKARVSHFRRFGFRSAARLRDRVLLDGRPVDVLLLAAKLR